MHLLIIDTNCWIDIVITLAIYNPIEPTQILDYIETHWNNHDFRIIVAKIQTIIQLKLYRVAWRNEGLIIGG